MSDHALLEKFKARLESDGKILPLTEWAPKNLFIRGKRISFDEHPEHFDIYGDQHPNKVFRKSVQVGISTYAIALMLYLACNYPIKPIYGGPTDKWIRKFSDDRVAKVIKDSPELRKRIGRIFNTFQRDVGFSTLYFATFGSEADWTSIDGDIVIADETDVSNQDIISIARDRLEHSALAWTLQLSKPSVPDFSIDEAFKEGDQRFRHFICPHCGTYNDIVENIYQEPLAVLRLKKKKGEELYYFACQECDRPLDPAKAEWVAKYPSKTDIRSYHVTQAYWTKKPAHYSNVAEKLYKTILSAFTLDDKKYFWRSLMGLPFAGDEQPLTDALLNTVQGNHALRPSFAGRSVMGVDQGEKLHVAIGHPVGYRLLFHWFQELDSFEELDPLMKKHNVRLCLIDYKPNTHEAKKFAQRFKNRVAVQDFRGETIEEKTTKKGKEVIRRVDLPRTESLDEMVDYLVGGIAVLPALAAGKEMKAVRKHLKKIIKEKCITAAGIETFKYKDRCENHYGMAINSALHAYLLLVNNIVRSSGVLPRGGQIGRKNATTH